MPVQQDHRLQRLAELPLFKGHPLCTLELVGRVADLLDVRSGRVLLRQGEWTALFLIVAAGRAVLERHGRRVGALGPGQWIGELLLLGGHPHDVTVVADGPLSVYVLDRRGFNTICHGVPGLRRRLLLSALAGLDRRDSGVASESG